MLDIYAFSYKKYEKLLLCHEISIKIINYYHHIVRHLSTIFDIMINFS